MLSVRRQLVEGLGRADGAERALRGPAEALDTPAAVIADPWRQYSARYGTPLRHLTV